MAEINHESIYVAHPNAIIISDLNTGNILDCNPATERITNMTKNEIIGNQQSGFRPWCQATEYKARLSELIEKGHPIDYQGKIYTKEGEDIPVRVSASLVEIDDQEFVIEVLTQRSENKQTEDALRESVARWRALVENSPDIIFSVARDGTIQTINRMATTDSIPKDAIGKKIDQFVLPDHAKKMMDNYEHLFQTGQPLSYEELGPGPNGPESAWYQIRLMPIRSDGKVCNVMQISTDITERKLVEEALKESEEKFRTLSEQSYLGIIILQEGMVKYTNQALAKMIEYSVEEMLDWKPYQFGQAVYPDDNPFVLEQARKKQEGAKDIVVQYQYRLVTRSGNILWVDQYSKTIQYEGRTADFATIIDITKHRLAEKALQDENEELETRVEKRTHQLDMALNELRSKVAEHRDTEIALAQQERYFRSLIEYSSDGIIVARSDGTIAYKSPTYQTILGSDAQERIDTNAIDPTLIHPDDLPQVNNTLEKLTQCPSEIQYIQLRVQHADDSWHWLECSAANHLSDPAIEGIVINYRDITERKHAEEALQESETKYSTLVEQSKDGVFISQDRICRFANKAMAEMLGYSIDEMIGMDIIRIVPTELTHTATQKYEERISGQEIPPIYEATLLCKDGTTKSVEISPARIQYEGKVATMSCLRDITERKRLWDELKESQNREEWAVLEERNRMAREVHDVLAQGFAGVIIQLEGAEQVAAKGHIAKVNQRINCALSVARDSIAESRRFLQDILPRSLENNPLEKALRRETANFTRRTGIKAETTVFGDPIPLPSDVEVGLLRICQESLTNASKHANANRVQVELAFEGAAVKLNVRDNGHGININTPAESGFGIAIMRERAKDLGGKLRIRSSETKGTTIAVTLPISDSSK